MNTDGPLTFTGLIKFLQYIKGPDHWHYVGETGEPALANSWVNFDTNWQAARFIKDAAGVVHIEGLVKSGTIGQVIFTLPVGYRPAKEFLISTNSNNAVARMDVYDDGTVVPADGSNVFYSIHVSFYVG